MNNKNNKLFLAGGIFLSSVIACGKYAAPIPPEDLAPKAVHDIQVLPYQKGVVLKWTGSTDDVRSKELKTMNGYYIERACLEDNSLINSKADDSLENLDFDVLAIVNDNQVSLREKLKDNAREKGLAVRRVKVPSDKLKFNYVDETIKYNDLCYYKITPFNQGNVRGLESAPIKVKFNGQDSFVVVTGKKDFSKRKVQYDN